MFRVLELNHNLMTYMEKRRTVLDSLSQFKQTLRQQSMENASIPESDTLSQEEAALNLCLAVHKFHFQLLLLLSSFLKLMDILTPQMEKNEVRYTTDYSLLCCYLCDYCFLSGGGGGGCQIRGLTWKDVYTINFTLFCIYVLSSTRACKVCISRFSTPIQWLTLQPNLASDKATPSFQ